MPSGTDSCPRHTHLADSCYLLGVIAIASGDSAMPTTSLPSKCVPSHGGDFIYPFLQCHFPDVLACQIRDFYCFVFKFPWPQCPRHPHLADSRLLLGVFTIAVGDSVMPTTSPPRKSCILLGVIAIASGDSAMFTASPPSRCVPPTGGNIDCPWGKQRHNHDIPPYQIHAFYRW